MESLKNNRFVTINRIRRGKSVTIMSNIPLIHQNRIFTGAWLKQSNKVIASESTDNNTPVIKRCLERRRKHLSTKQKTVDSIDMSGTKGKHINITA